MIAGAFEMAVPDAHLLLAMSRADARIYVEHDASGRMAAMNFVDPRQAIAQFVSNRFHQFLRHLRIDEAAKLTVLQRFAIRPPCYEHRNTACKSFERHDTARRESA
jgi:hypothetical protein